MPSPFHFAASSPHLYEAAACCNRRVVILKQRDSAGFWCACAAPICVIN